MSHQKVRGSRTRNARQACCPMPRKEILGPSLPCVDRTAFSKIQPPTHPDLSAKSDRPTTAFAPRLCARAIKPTSQSRAATQSPSIRARYRPRAARIPQLRAAAAPGMGCCRTRMSGANFCKPTNVPSSDPLSTAMISKLKPSLFWANSERMHGSMLFFRLRNGTTMLANGGAVSRTLAHGVAQSFTASIDEPASKFSAAARLPVLNAVSWISIRKQGTAPTSLFISLSRRTSR